MVSSPDYPLYARGQNKSYDMRLHVASLCTCENATSDAIVRQPQWSSPSVILRERESENKGTLPQRRVRLRRERLID